jgi:hypothetical protein
VVQQRTERQPIRPRRRKVVDGHIGIGERAVAAPSDESLASCGGRSRPIRLAFEWRLGRSDRITRPQRWVIAIETKIQLANTLPIILNCVIGVINLINWANKSKFSITNYQLLGQKMSL